MRESGRITDAFVDTLSRGTDVDILNPFVPSWSPGFVIDEVLPHGYKVRRAVDDHVLPRLFAVDEVRPANRPSSAWW